MQIYILKKVAYIVEMESLNTIGNVNIIRTAWIFIISICRAYIFPQ